jgi:3-dehydro-L-gulonate-6-phosphate decarboxylase
MRPRLQLALDTPDLPSALGPLAKAVSQIDVIEVGTILILAEGLRAVREIRAVWPEATILADVRIAEAGGIIARRCFEAGASWVSVVADASLTTIEQVVAQARQFGGQVQVELGESLDPATASAWRERGVEHVIVHRSRDSELAGRLEWGPLDLDRIAELDAMGFTVTVTGGITAAELDALAGAPVGIVIAGRAIVKADSPLAAAAELKAAIARVWPE